MRGGRDDEVVVSKVRNLVAYSHPLRSVVTPFLSIITFQFVVHLQLDDGSVYEEGSGAGEPSFLKEYGRRG